MKIRLGDKIDKQGKIRAVKDDDYVMTPTIGFLVHTDDGVFAITARDEAYKCEGVGHAMSYIGQKWRGRK